MSIADLADEIEYAESDGLPMGETELHQNWMIRILEIFRQRYRGQRVYTASNLLVYYKRGVPTRYVVPDNFVVLNCESKLRKTFKTWAERRVPDVVVEVTSRSTAKEDLNNKPKIYAEMGVKEYFLYDPTGAYLKPPLQGFQLTRGTQVRIEPRNGVIQCKTLGISFRLNDDDLVMFDTATGSELLTNAETERAARAWERAEKDRERMEKEAALRLIEELKQELRRRDRENQ